VTRQRVHCSSRKVSQVVKDVRDSKD
jgi:hypothetical protein